MPIADNKKAQTIRNLWHKRVAVKILEADAVVAAIRAAITDNSLAAEFTVGELSAMTAVETDLSNLAVSVGVTAAAGKYVPTHRSQSIAIPGVNDG